LTGNSTTEEIIPNEEIRREPDRTAIPFYVVDAVCEVPYGAHPTLMPYQYYFDENHIREWMTLAKTAEGAQEYFEKYVFGVADFDEYLEKISGLKTLSQLKQVELLRAPLPDAAA
jgi:glutaconate CoA-transferase, subunit A